MHTMQPFELKAETGRNVLLSLFRGSVKASHMKGPVDHVQSLLKKLAPRFTLITDLTDLESMDIDCVPHLARFMDQCRTAGIGKVIRVIPDPKKDIGFKLLSLTHYRGKVPIVVCESRAEAEKELART